MTEQLAEEGKARPRTGIPAGLWVGVLLPPIVWALQMQINYWAVRGACARGSNTGFYAVIVIALLLIAFSGLFAWTDARRSGFGGRVEWGTVVSNSRFMLALGLLCGAVFFVAVVAQGLAAVVFHPCQL